MKGLELARAFYDECGKPMLEEKFGDVLPYLAVGLCGSGSECSGFDDEFSQDHDFEPGFMIFLPGEDVVDRRTAFLLEREYAKLPKEFMGYKRQQLSPVGGNRHGVIRTAEFFESHVGNGAGELTPDDFIRIPENYLSEATNGEIFVDRYGEVSDIRGKLSYFPEDVRLKKIAGNLLLCGQSGQYNFPRILKRDDNLGAQSAIYEFAKSAVNIFFLLNGKYKPYYKWVFRALRELPGGNDFCEMIDKLIQLPSNNDTYALKMQTVEDIFRLFISKLDVKENATSFEEAAYIINSKIQENGLRNAHVLYGV